MVKTQTSNIEERIERVIDTFINNGTMFTLLDVSQAVKNDGGEWMSHSRMKPFIEEVLKGCFSTQLVYSYYTESTIEVNTPAGKMLARLFHPVGQNPDGYIHRNQQASAPSKAKSFPKKILPPNHPTVVGRQVIKNRAQTACGYAEVPAKVWKKAGFAECSSGLLCFHKESITILRGDVDSKYRIKYEDGDVKNLINVPSSGRFRLGPNSLRKSNLEGCELDFSAFTDKIVVSRKV